MAEAKENLRCCFYRAGDEERYICTNDPECPQLNGWELVGSWGVRDCDDCFRHAREGVRRPKPATESGASKGKK